MQFYRESDLNPVASMVRAMCLGFPLAALIGAGYCFLLHLIRFNIPVLQLIYFATAGVMAAFAYLMARLLNHTKIRSTGIFLLFAGMWSLVAWYVAWAVDPVARLGWNQGFFAFDPRVLYEYMQALYQQGAFRIHEALIKGIPLVCYWCAELAILVGTPMVWALRMRGTAPFCESCNCWTKYTLTQHYEYLPENDPLMQRLLAGDLRVLKEMSLFDFEHAPASRPMPWIRMDLATCPTCPNSNYLSVAYVEPSRHGKARIKYQNRYLLRHLLVSESQLPLVRQAEMADPPQESSAEPEPGDPQVMDANSY